jgi:cation transporter-like permease
MLKTPGDAATCGCPLHLVASAGDSPPSQWNSEGHCVVWLIVYYVIFMIAGDLAAYVIGLVTEREFGSEVSLIVFLTLYFLFLWVAWVLAVWITKPPHVEPAST